MLTKVINLLSRILLKKGRITVMVRIVFVLLLLFPLLILMAFNYLETYRQMTWDVLNKNTDMAHLSSILVQERLDKLVDIAVALSGRPKLIDEIRKDDWTEGVKFLKNVISDFPQVLGVGLYDTQGVVKEGWPGFQKIIGTDFSYRDWYKGVSRQWQPYVSEVYRRRADPSLNIVSIAVPIRNIDLAGISSLKVEQNDNREVLGILLLHVRLEVFSGWIKDLHLGPGESIYIVDKRGQMIYHPKFALQGPIMDFSRIPLIRDFINGREGTVVMRDPFEEQREVTTFDRVDKYNWGVFLTVPVKFAFAERESHLRFIIWVYLIIGTLTVILALLILQIYEDRRRQEVEVKAINDMLASRNIELEFLNKELESFSYSVSHDLRAPLRSMDGFSQALLEDCAGKLEPKEEDYLKRIRGSCKHMAELIDDLLVLSQVTRRSIWREEIDLSRKAREIAARLRETDPGRRVEFAIGDGIIAYADNNLIEVVLENLLGNAWKFTKNKDQARIEFGQESLNGKPVYFVKDNGAGFDTAYIDKLFVPFQRLHTTSEFEGTGIGLASVRRIISRHGGKVWAEGLVDKGAKFCFTLS